MNGLQISDFGLRIEKNGPSRPRTRGPEIGRQLRAPNKGDPRIRDRDGRNAKKGVRNAELQPKLRQSETRNLQSAICNPQSPL